MADYLSEEEQLERLKNWWSEHGTTLVVGLVLTVAGVAGWRWYDSTQAQGRQADSELYESYLSAQGESRDALAERLDTERKATTYRVFSLLHRAKEKVGDEDIDSAVALLKAAIDANPGGPLADVVRIRLARLQRQQNDVEAALATLGQVRTLGLRGQVQETKGDMHLAAGEGALAHEAYVAALSEVGDEARRRAILEMKANDAADADPDADPDA